MAGDEDHLRRMIVAVVQATLAAERSLAGGRRRTTGAHTGWAASSLALASVYSLVINFCAFGFLVYFSSLNHLRICSNSFVIARLSTSILLPQ